MDVLSRLNFSLIRAYPSDSRLMRFLRWLWYFVTDALIFIGAGALVAGVWYLVWAV